MLCAFLGFGFTIAMAMPTGDRYLTWPKADVRYLSPIGSDWRVQKKWGDRRRPDY